MVDSVPGITVARWCITWYSLLRFELVASLTQFVMVCGSCQFVNQNLWSSFGVIYQSNLHEISQDVVTHAEAFIWSEPTIINKQIWAKDTLIMSYWQTQHAYTSFLPLLLLWFPGYCSISPRVTWWVLQGIISMKKLFYFGSNLVTGHRVYVQ